MNLPAFKNNGPLPHAKTFWQQKKAQWGIFGVVAAGLVGIIAMTALFPILTAFIMGGTSLLIQAALFAIVAAPIAFVAYTVSRPQVRTMMLFWHRGLVSRWKKRQIRNNPVGMMNTYLDMLREKMVDCQVHSGTLGRRKGVMKSKREDFQNKLEHQLDLGVEIRQKLADATDHQEKIDLSAKLGTANMKIGSLSEAIKTCQNGEESLELRLRVLEKGRQCAQVNIDRLSHMVAMKEFHFENTTTTHAALKSAHDVYAGSGEDRDVFDEANEQVTIQTGEMQGDIDMMLGDLKNIMLDQDIDNAVYSSAGNKILLDYEAKLDRQLQAQGAVPIVAGDVHRALEAGKEGAAG